MPNNNENALNISSDASERAELIKNTPTGNYAGVTEDGRLCVVIVLQNEKIAVKVSNAVGYTLTHYNKEGEAISYERKGG